jgi:hypothetical protein
MLIYYLMLINLYIIASNAMTNERRCNTLYYGLMDKIKINTQSQRTKVVMENSYKRRSKQTGMTVDSIKNCYNSKIKIKKPKKV